MDLVPALAGGDTRKGRKMDERMHLKVEHISGADAVCPKSDDTSWGLVQHAVGDRVGGSLGQATPDFLEPHPGTYRSDEPT